MELTAAERCCCVVSVSGSFSGKSPASCSGVLLHPRSGTVVCTGLLFSRFLTDRKLLSRHRSFLSARSFSAKLNIRVFLQSERSATPPHGAPAELLMLVNCPEFQKTLRAVFQEADQWRFHGNEEDDELTRDAQVLSWFAVLRLGDLKDTAPAPELVSWQSSSSLHKGWPVVACGSPFGSLCLDLFIGTLSRGVISNLAGEDNAVILTDARCLPGTEGGGLFVVKGEHVSLVGVIVSPFGWKANEWIGLTLVCSVHSILRNIVRCVDTQDPLRDLLLHGAETGLQVSRRPRDSEGVEYPTVCLVDSGQFWGSGVMVAPQLTLTCRHVVNGKATVTLKFYHRDRCRHIHCLHLSSSSPRLCTANYLSYRDKSRIKHN